MLALQYRNRYFPLDKREVIVGRCPTTGLVIPHYMVSRKHCRLVVSERGLVLQDLESLNGTFLNGEPVFRRAVLVKVGDRIHLGTVEVCIVELERLPRARELQAYSVRNAEDASEGTCPALLPYEAEPRSSEPAPSPHS